VLRRGEEDKGATAQPDLVPPFPTLDAVQPPDVQLPAVLGEILVLAGHHLIGDDVEVQFHHPSLDLPNVLLPLPGSTDRQIAVQLPSDPAASAAWPAGVYNVLVIVRETVGGRQVERPTNEVALPLAPRIESFTPNPALRDSQGNVTLSVTFVPEVRPGQRAALLLGDREILPESSPGPPVQTGTLQFLVRAAAPGEYFLRLRIGGVDTILVDRGAPAPRFDDRQKVTIQ
jgi:hypothetical protein